MNSQHEASQLSALQKAFGVTALGFGDPVVGFNVLGAMACTLANLAPDDGTVIHRDGRVARLGTSLLVHGGASAGRVVDEIISEVCMRQARLTSIFRSYLGWWTKHKEDPQLAQSERRAGNEAVSLIQNNQFAAPNGGRANHWQEAIQNAQTERPLPLAGRPKFLVSAGTPADLKAQLKGLRPGRPLVHLGFCSPEDLSHYAETASALLEGRYPLGDDAVRGNIIVTDPMRVIDAAASDPDVRTAWLGQLLWLADGQAGPEPPVGETDGSPETDPMVAERFQRVLTSLMARRLHGGKVEPRDQLVLSAGTGPALVRWTEFLRKMEPSLPGISGACRNLLSSLIFGLGEMAKFSQALRYQLAGVEALARFLVRRMANTRTTILRAGEISRRQNQIQRIFGKISKGASSDQKIAKDLKIAAVERDECLKWMSETGLVFRGREGWEPCEGARLDFNHCLLPLLEA